MRVVARLLTALVSGALVIGASPLANARDETVNWPTQPCGAINEDQELVMDGTTFRCMNGGIDGNIEYRWFRMVPNRQTKPAETSLEKAFGDLYDQFIAPWLSLPLM